MQLRKGNHKYFMYLHYNMRGAFILYLVEFNKILPYSLDLHFIYYSTCLSNRSPESPHNLRKHDPIRQD
jgi:hypothetical protein